MKTNFTLLLLLLGAFLLPASAQLNNGGLHANFGVDADTKADYVKYGPQTGLITSEDWFTTTWASKGVIDTINTALYKSLLKQNKNIAFTQRMSAPLYYKNNNTMWIDAVYGRDYLKLDSVNLDTTGYTTSCKNAQDPAVWLGGPSGISNKNDIMDVFTHMRRNGLNIKDSLWLFMAASIVGTTGSKYFDVELFKNNVGYNASTGRFTTAGPDEGHTQWKFDAAGNITQTGDLIIACTYNPGSAPIIEVRIWVARTTHRNVVPAFFNFSVNQFDSDANSSVYGYASIISKNGSTAFGSGAGNYTVTGNDSTYSTPWGSNSKVWQEYYDGLQLVEVGINLTRVGIDPSLYSTLGNAACGSFFKSILYKSRSSASFSSALNDFVGPLEFMRIPVMDHTISNDSLSCLKTSATLNISSRTTTPHYAWSTTNGNITSATWDNTSITLNKGGSYIVNASVANGCAADRTDTIKVAADTLKPVATAAAGIDLLSRALLYGGDPVASNYPTPFGGSKGLAYRWTGPLNFTSTLRNPFINIWGVYNLTVTELRNGCTSSASVIANFTPLAVNNLELKGTLQNGNSVLYWQQAATEAVAYEVEKSMPGTGFMAIETKKVHSFAAQGFEFRDPNLLEGYNVYRIKEISRSGTVQYSNIIRLNHSTANPQNRFTYDAATQRWYLVLHVEKAGRGTISLYSTSGVAVKQQPVSLNSGRNLIFLDHSSLKGMAGLAVVETDQLPLFSQKIIF